MSSIVPVDTLIVVTIALIVIVSSVVTMGVKLWPFITKMNQIAEDWAGEPERPGVPHRPGLLERVAAIEKHSKSADFNSKPNHGTSAHDQVMKSIEGLKSRVDDMSTAMELSQNDRLRLWLAVNDIKEKTNGTDQ